LKQSYRLYGLYVTQKTSSKTAYRGENANEEVKSGAFVSRNAKVITVLYLKILTSVRFQNNALQNDF